MIGWVRTAVEIPAGSVIYYDDEMNCLVVFSDEMQVIYVKAMPFVVAGLDPPGPLYI